jgi:predicted transcriptional regulator
MRLSTDLRVNAVMDERVPLCAAHHTVGHVLGDLLELECGHAIVFGFDGKPVGIARLADLISVDPDSPITRFMSPMVLWISAHESVAVAVRVMAMSNTDFLVVHDDAGAVLGGIGTRNLIRLGTGLDTVELTG